MCYLNVLLLIESKLQQIQFFFFQAEDGIRDRNVTGVQTCALPICWTEEQCRTFALADNQVALNAQWDRDMLGVELRELRELGADISLTGFSQKELERLTSGSNDPGPGFTLESAYQILIECADEAEQLKLLGRLRAENVKCRALIA